ncbi:T9SS type A sorting domain-containing protein [Pseudarcicella hirudinis]|uniref:T9SS type A sorting domain-containing protein n=1 Tax=Pseudarcicella hirudinis TaxID=1079859 RepID=UPI0035EEB431
MTDIQWQLIDRNNVLTTIETTPKSNTFPFLIPPYLLSGTYQIKVNVLNCKGGDVASLAYIQPPPLVLETSLDEIHPFIAFPNPTSGRLEIKFFAKKAQTAAFTLTDMQGKKMISKELVSKEGVNSYEFDIKNIPSGTYLIHLQSDNNQETFKIFKTDQ